MSQKTLRPASIFLLALPLAFFPWGRAESALFSRADVNQDGALDIGDPIKLLFFLFLSDGTAPDCQDSLDVNDSGAVDVSDGVSLLNYLFLGGAPPEPPFPGCGTDPTEDGLSCERFSDSICPPLGPPEGELVKTSDCKSGTKDLNPSPSEECLEYSFDEGYTLTLKHLNAGFNCCPVFHGDVKIEGGAIAIIESETFEDGGPCRCLCLFDLDYEIRNLDPGEYTIAIEGVYGTSLKATAELIPGDTGSYCEKRDDYPWGPP